MSLSSSYCPSSASFITRSCDHSFLLCFSSSHSLTAFFCRILAQCSRLTSLMVSLSVMRSPVCGLLIQAGLLCSTFGPHIISFIFHILLVTSLYDAPVSISSFSSSHSSLYLSLRSFDDLLCFLFFFPGPTQTVPKQLFCVSRSSVIIFSLTSSMVRSLLLTMLLMALALLSVCSPYFSQPSSFLKLMISFFSLSLFSLS